MNLGGRYPFFIDLPKNINWFDEVHLNMEFIIPNNYSVLPFSRQQSITQDLRDMIDDTTEQLNAFEWASIRIHMGRGTSMIKCVKLNLYSSIDITPSELENVLI